MILNALDEVLFWDDIDVLKVFMRKNLEGYYPHSPDRFYNSKVAFFASVIPNKSEFLHRLERYAESGCPAWISGRNELSDDIDTDTMIKAISISSQTSNGEKKAAQASKWQENAPSFWQIYSDNILHTKNNIILELTVGAGGGTNAVMRNMKNTDYYMGVDIDFICAKNADALAKYYHINGLGIATSLWNLPFEDRMFTSVCCNAGLEECREIPTILSEACRVLAPKGRIVLHCLEGCKAQGRDLFDRYGFSEEEMLYWLKKVRLYVSADEVEKLLSVYGLKKIERKTDETLGCILIYEK